MNHLTWKAERQMAARERERGRERCCRRGARWRVTPEAGASVLNDQMWWAEMEEKMWESVVLGGSVKSSGGGGASVAGPRCWMRGENETVCEWGEALVGLLEMKEKGMSGRYMECYAWVKKRGFGGGLLWYVREKKRVVCGMCGVCRVNETKRKRESGAGR